MLTALAGEAAASSRFTTRVLLGAGVPFSPPAGVSVVRIPRGREGDGLLTAASASDWLVVVAPETAGILARRLHSLSSRGCRLASPTAAFAALAADKQATMLALAAAGVPVPAGRLLRAGSCPPPGFRLPMVRKRVDSTGCDGLVMIESPTDAGGPAVHDERLEASVGWLPVSVSLLCGKACLLPLPPVIQQFSQGRSPAYLGGKAAGSSIACASGPPAGRAGDSRHGSGLTEWRWRARSRCWLGGRRHDPCRSRGWAWRPSAGDQSTGHNIPRGARTMQQGESDRCHDSGGGRGRAQPGLSGSLHGSLPVCGSPVLAFDIGGANLKAADGVGWCHAEPFAMWKERGRLVDALRRIRGMRPDCRRFVATMTGEIADCFS